MNVNASTPVRDITISKVIFSVPAPFTEDHISDSVDALGMGKAGIAHSLNQTLAENLRNNFRETVDEAVEKGEQTENERASDALQKAMDEYVASYEFGTTSGGLRSTDPVESAMNQIAMTAVKNQLKKAGHKLSDYESKELTRLRDELKAKYADQIRSKAERQVAEQQDFLSSIDA